MQYGYDLQLPDMNMSVYKPRAAYPTMLGKVNDIAVDTSCLNTIEGLNVPESEPHYAHEGAVWVSAKINSHRLGKGDPSFLGNSPGNVLKTRRRGGQGVQSSVFSLNFSSKEHGFIYTLQRIDKWESILLALLEGYTVMIGGSVYESFELAVNSGIVPMPEPGEALLGGHIVNLISFDQKEDIGVAIGNLGMQAGRRGLLTYRGSYFRNLAICRDFFVLNPRYEHAN